MRAGRGDSALKSVVLVGFMAAGKSRIGRLLAERLGLPFVDTDKQIVLAYGLSVAEIFREHGEGEFRSAERRTIARLLEGPRQVIAIGGGAYVDPQTRETLNTHATTVWLDPPFDLVFRRLTKSSTRPLASGKTPAELRRLWDERRQCYAMAQVHIRTSDAPAGIFADEILEQLVVLA